MTSLAAHLHDASARRTSLTDALKAEVTNCWRLFHGIAEGRPGLVIDRYGDLTLAQSFREPLQVAEIEFLVDHFGHGFVYNHRGPKKDRFSYHDPAPDALALVEAQELGLRYGIKARHRGIDPHLFMDLRVGRRWVKQNASGKSVLNLFAYSCGLGQVAQSAGASEVWNVDFSATALNVGRENLKRNSLTEESTLFIQEDYFPVIWQLAGLGVKGKRARRKFTKFAPRQFDLICLDPPAKAKGPFQTVDLVNDYQSLFKPALMVCAQGGQLLVTNNVGSVDRGAFGDMLVRCAEKAGRPLQSLEWLEPDEDFPSFDGCHPLKIALCRL